MVIESLQECSSQLWLVTLDKGRLFSRGWLTSHHLLGPYVVFHNSNGRLNDINHTFINYKSPSIHQLTASSGKFSEGETGYVINRWGFLRPAS